ARYCNYRNLTADQVGRQLRHPFILPLRPAVFDRDVLTFHETGFVETFAERGHIEHPGVDRTSPEKSDHRHRGLLRAGRERPCRRCTAGERDELAALHSITSSARASSDGGTSRPSAFAVVRLITRSNLVGCSTGMSAGFAPRKILSTNS